MAKCSHASKTWNDPSNSTHRYIPKGIKGRDLDGCFYTSVQCDNFHNSQKAERTQMSINIWINKTYIQGEYYSAVKMNAGLVRAATRMSLEDLMLGKISQTQRNKCSVILLVWNSYNKFMKTNWLEVNGLSGRRRRCYCLVLAGFLLGVTGELRKWWWRDNIVNVINTTELYT